jgi:lysophospholipase L1-like esterase
LPWPKRVAFTTIALGAGLFLILMVAEVVLRIAAFESFRGTSHTIEDAELTWINEVSTQTEVRGVDFRYEIRTNSLGLRGTELQPSATGRILLLGDSYTFGAGVDDGETFAAQLQQIMEQRGPDGWEAVNAGVSGYGAVQSRLFALRIWDEVQPKIVIYTHCGNDFGDDLRFSKGTYRSIRNRLPGRKFLKEHSVVYNLTKPLVLAALSRLGIYNPQIEFEAGNEGALVSALGKTWAQGRDITCAALAEMQRDAQQRDASLLVTTVGFWSGDDRVELSTDARAVIDCLEEQGIPFLDPRLAFPEREEEPWNNHDSAGHFSPLGNRFFAESLYEGLRERGLLGAGQVNAGRVRP